MSLTRVIELMARGLSKTEALDYVVVTESGVPVEDWLAIRNVESEKAITKNVEKAADTLNKQESVQSHLIGNQEPDQQRTTLPEAINETGAWE